MTIKANNDLYTNDDLEGYGVMAQVVEQVPFEPKIEGHSFRRLGVSDYYHIQVELTNGVMLKGIVKSDKDTTNPGPLDGKFTGNF